jgi:hypothetical protein
MVVIITVIVINNKKILLYKYIYKIELVKSFVHEMWLNRLSVFIYSVDEG